MRPSRLRTRPFRRFVSAATAAALVAFGFAAARRAPTASAQGPAPSFRNFESPQVHPLALTPDGTRLLAVNSPNATLSVFQLSGGQPVLTAEIPVGLEPVSVAARNDREAWVVNWLSDSVSVVDLTTGNVTRTIDVGDEPTDVVFAGSARELAFVCVSGGGSLLTGTTLERLGRGQVKVFDPSSASSTPLSTVELFAKQPRALARSADGARVFVSVFESGNQTTIVPESAVKANGGLPPPDPAMRAGLPAAPATSLIVRWNGSQWIDELNRPWNGSVPYTLADIDLVVLDASGASAPNSVAAQVRGLGTHIGNMAFDPAGSRLYVANLEDINHVRFEPKLQGRFQSSRVSVLSAPPGVAPAPSAVSDLNPHVNFNAAGTDQVRAQSLALPGDVARQSDGTVYVAATSSARVGVLSPAGEVTGRIGVGQGPTGLAVDEARSRLYVLNRFDQTVSVVDTGSKAEVSQVPVGFNPEPQSVREGRRFLYDASNSSHGTVSCASCHLNGHRDGVAWDLGNPLGDPDPVATFFPPGPGGNDNLHPMKGPMTTQSLRGIIGTEPLHWRGDRAALVNFNGAFASLLGGRLLTSQEMAAFQAFVQSLTYPPNPHEPLTRPPVQQRPGFGFFSFEKLGAGTVNCSDCHLVTNFRSGTDNRITPADKLQQTQSLKVPQLRGLYQKTGMSRSPGEKLAGYGFSHDGSFDTLFNFMKAPFFVFNVDPSTADSWRRDMERMILELDTGTAPAVGLQVTVNAANRNSGAVTQRISLLNSQAQAGNCDLVVKGLYGGSPRGFLRLADGTFQPDSLSEAPVALETLLAAVGPGSELTFTGVPPGAGRRLGIDRDADATLDDDEPRSSVSISGRVVSAAGQPLAGVSVTLSGTQRAVATTDALGRYVFNFVSVSGVHTVTPAAPGQAFSPAQRTFANPSWHQSAAFISSATANASDATSFFVRQHYNDFLNREPDDAGLQFWSGDIEKCAADGQCRQVKRVNVSAAFFLSIEFQETGYLVYRMYKAAFGDPAGRPVPVSFENLMTDTQRIGRNVQVGVGNWAERLEANKRAYALGFVGRPDFQAAFAGLSPEQFVDRLNQNAGGALDAGERQALVAELTANNTAQGRATVLRRVADDQTLRDAELRKAFVLMQYFGYLRRDPDDVGFDGQADPEFKGFHFWLGKLNEHNGNFVQAEMVRAFIESIEYRQRFGQ